MLPPQTTQTLELSTELIFVPRTEAEFEQLVTLLDEISDVVRDDETHPLAKVMDVLAVLIAGYEDEHEPLPHGNPMETLRYLMDLQGLSATALPELGDAIMVEEILTGQRLLTLPQIRALGHRFAVSPTAFM